MIESGTGKNMMALVGTPGLKSILATGKQEPIRGLCTLGAKRILVAGYETLYDVSLSAGGLVELGNIAPATSWDGEGAVTFAFNGTQYCIASGGHGYILDNSTDELTETIPMHSVDYCDGYFVALQTDTRQVRISGLYDGLTWDPLDFKEKESNRDYPAAILCDHGEIWVFGETHSEVWYNSGNSDFPFDRVPGGRLELGCAAPWSPCKLDNSVFWIGNDERGNRVVWRADGYSAKRISNHPIEYRMNLMVPRATGPTITASTTTFAICWAYQEEGHSFYCIVFPKGPEFFRGSRESYSNPTMLVYDCATQMWHERAYWNPNKGMFEPHRARCHCFIWDHHFVGDRENGRIYEQHLNYYDDDGDRIRRERIGPHVHSGMKRIFYKSFQLDMEVAVGLGVIDSDLYGPDKDGITYDGPGII